MIDPRVIIEDFLESHDLDFERANADSFLVTLPGDKKLQTHCALQVGDNSLSINAFVIRKPDENAGMSITESFAMLPTAAVSGWYFAHPEARYFSVTRVQKDQVDDYAERKGLDLITAERWLSPVLGYDV